MSRHIPGPWNYSQESVDPEWWIVTIEGGLIIANVNAHAHQEANAKLIAAAPDLLRELQAVRSLIAEAAMTGFNCREGDWAERLFASQGSSAEAVKKAGGDWRTHTPEQR